MRHEWLTEELDGLLTEALQIAPDSPQDLTMQQVLGKYFASKLLIVWSVDDIIEYARTQMEKTLSFDEGLYILQGLERHLDSEQGITWDAIEFAIDDYVHMIVGMRGADQ